MIPFRKILDAPATWKSEPIFAQPRYLIQAVSGKFSLFHCQVIERQYAFLAAFTLCQDAQSWAELHHKSLTTSSGAGNRLVSEAISA